MWSGVGTNKRELLALSDSEAEKSEGCCDEASRPKRGDCGQRGYLKKGICVALKCWRVQDT
jgi:hypothetical protein